jgi:hypothetical protein
MLPEKVRSCLYRFLIGVDEFVSRHAMLKPRPIENELTNKLVQSFNPENENVPGLDFSAKKFQREVEEISRDECYESPCKLTFSQEPYTQTFEGSITQADLYLELKYHDPISELKSWTAAYLIQAKFPPTKDCHQTNIYQAIRYDNQQITRIEKLKKLIGADSFKFIFYCGKNVLTTKQECLALSLLESDLQNDQDSLRSYQTAGIWVTAEKYRNVDELLQVAHVSSFGLAKFIVSHYETIVDSSTLNLRYHNRPDVAPENQYMVGIRDRDQNILSVIAESLGTTQSGTRNQKIYKLTIDVQGPRPQPQITDTLSP